MFKDSFSCVTSTPFPFFHTPLNSFLVFGTVGTLPFVELSKEEEKKKAMAPIKGLEEKEEEAIWKKMCVEQKKQEL